jgi:hypothetical protein
MPGTPGFVARLERGGAFGPFYLLADEAPKRLAFDGAHTVFGVGDGGKIFQLGTVGGSTHTIYLPYPDLDLAVARDGRAFITTRGPVLELTLGSTQTRTSTIFPNGLTSLAIVDRERMLALDPMHLLTFDGARWSPEYAGPELSAASPQLAADESLMAFLGDSKLLLRDEGSHLWSLAPPSPRSLRAIAAIGSARLLGAGDLGTLAIYDGGAWCAVESGTVHPLVAVSLSPDRKTAVAVGFGAPYPAVVWVDLP